MGIAVFAFLFLLTLPTVRAQSNTWDSLLTGSQWYVPAENLLAYVASGTNLTELQPVADQTIWSISDCVNGEFTGTSVATFQLGPVTSTSTTSMNGVITDSGQIRIVFTGTNGSSTVGVGQVEEVEESPLLEMQMTTGDGGSNGIYLTHWAYMAPYDGDPSLIPPQQIDSTPNDIDDAWSWLPGSQWGLTNAALFGAGGMGSFEIEGYTNGYFWGTGAGPIGSSAENFTLLGSATPEGVVLINILSGTTLTSLTGQIAGSFSDGSMVLRSYESSTNSGEAAYAYVLPQVFSGQEITKPISTLDQLSDWKPGIDPWNVATVPLKPRAAADYAGSQVWVQNAPDQTTKNLVFSMHDMAGGYQTNQDAYPAGTTNNKLYTFTQWQYIDFFNYFAHDLVSFPPPGWTDTAHRNGVKCLGTFISDTEPTKKAIDAILETPQSRSKYVQKLVQIARYYKFDGYLINIEKDVDGRSGAENLEAFVAQLKSAVKAAIPGGQVVWYDAINMCNGVVDWQNVLNAVNLPYFLRSDGIVINYFWGLEDQPVPETSATNAGKRALDVFTGIDAFNREQDNQKYYEFESYEGVGAAVQADTSVGLFGQAWPYETAKPDKSDFPERDEEFWVGTAPSDSNPVGGIAEYIAARPVPSALPFITDFNRGFGNATYTNGGLISQAPWGNVGLVDVLPTWRETAIPGSSTNFTADFTSQTAFNGGTAFQFSATGASTNTYSLRPLFRTQFSGVKKVSYSLSQSGLDGALVLVTASSRVIILPAVSSQAFPPSVNWGVMTQRGGPAKVAPSSTTTQNGWETRTYDLGRVLTGQKIVAIGFLVFPDGSTDEQQSLNLGEIQAQ